MLDPKKGRKYFENGDVYNGVLNSPKSVSDCVIDCITTKPLKCKDEKEYRLILCSNNEYGEYSNDMVKVKPCRLIISSKLIFVYKQRIIDYCKINHIPYSIVKIDNN